MIAYKLFKVKNNKLYPLYVLAYEEVPIGVWLDAKEGPKTKSGKVRSKLGDLAFRPGWHLSEIPLATHIGIKENGVIKYMHNDEVWCECEYSGLIDYQLEAYLNGFKNGKYSDKRAMLTKIPYEGFYKYRTSPVMLGKWIIAGSMKVNRVLTDEEVSTICIKKGYNALPRKCSFPYVF